MPFDPLVRPTQEDIDRELSTLQHVWDGALSAMDTAYNFYTRQYPIWDSKDPRQVKRPVFRSGKATSLIDHAVDATLSFAPKFHRPEKSEEPEARKAASRLERGIAAIFRDAMLQGDYYPPKVNGKQLAITNYTQLYVGLDENALKPTRRRGENRVDFDRREWEWESNRHAWNPIRIEALAPGEVLMAPGEKSPPLALRLRKLRGYELEDLLSRKAKKRGTFVSDWRVGIGKDPYDELEVIERWSAHWYAMKLDSGDLLLVEPNTWGFQPFIQTFAGAAVIPTVSRLHSIQARDPRHYVEQALLFAVMDDLVMLDQMVVGQQELLQNAAWARRGYRGDTAEAAQQLKGDILQGEEADWWSEKLPQLPQQAFTHEGILKADLEESTYSMLEAGFAQGGMDTATHVIVLSEKVHRKFQPAVTQVNHLYSIAASNVLKLVHRMHDRYGEEFEGIDIGDDSLRVADIGGRFNIYADFGQVDTVTYLQQKQDARQELQMGLIDEETYFAIARYEDVAGIRKRRMMDRARRLPQVDQILLAAAIRELGLGILADQMEEQARMGEAVIEPQGAPAQNGGAPPSPPTANRGLRGTLGGTP